MRRVAPLAIAVLIACSAPLAAQEPPPDPSEIVTEPSAPETPDAAAAPPVAPRTMIGTWEFSNADREKICMITFRNDTTAVGKRVDFDPKCKAQFPFVPEVAGWRQNGNDFLRLVDARGNSVLEFNEVETGIFEAPKPGEGILFIQNPQDLGPAPKTADQITGEWTLVRRTGQPICRLTLTNTAVGEEFALQFQRAGCDPAIVRFAPATWQMDRGEIVLRSADGQSWRFEEADGGKWRRLPETASPMLMVRK